MGNTTKIEKPTKQDTCLKHINNIKRISGWVFADMFHFYFGEGTVIFEKESGDAKNIEFTITGKWLEENHATKFGVDSEMVKESYRHVARCLNPECVEQKGRFEAINEHFTTGRLPGGPQIILVSACQDKRRGARVTLSRRKGFGESIDEILPFIKWFIDKPDFWIWPD